MLNPRKAVLPLLCLALLVVATFGPAGSPLGARGAQQTFDEDEAPEQVKRGIELYQQGDDKGAIALLQPALKYLRGVVSGWHYLGLAYERQGKTKDARKAHETAARAGERMLGEVFSASSPNDAQAATKFRPLLLMAAESADKYLKLSSNPPHDVVQDWSYRSGVLHEYADLFETDARNKLLGKIYKSSEVTTRARILRRAEPQYTEEARENRISGTVVLRAVFAFDGKLRGIRVVSGLPNGLTMRAIEAARAIKFIPATINNQPVSQFIQIEYNFNLTDRIP
ncbi:MAG TPA: TonB family protein [Pyrinomonadaceae bacterium]|nr:TonB family protein [Pyrinomonadaceae bacterium]